MCTVLLISSLFILIIIIIASLALIVFKKKKTIAIVVIFTFFIFISPLLLYLFGRNGTSNSYEIYYQTIGILLAPIAGLLAFLTMLFSLYQMQNNHREQQDTSNFIDLVNLHLKKVENLYLDYKNTKYDKIAVLNEFNKLVHENINPKDSDGNDKYTEEQLKDNTTRLSALINAVNQAQKDCNNYIGHYFRSYFHVIDFIERNRLSENYRNIYRAQLTRIEVTAIYYNCFSSEYSAREFLKKTYDWEMLNDIYPDDIGLKFESTEINNKKTEILTLLKLALNHATLAIKFDKDKKNK